MTFPSDDDSLDAAKPLASLILVTYNQQAYIRDAVTSVLAQNYSPLEIVICDDCSTDNTVQIIGEMAEAYQGPHKLVLDLSTQNAGANERVNQGIRNARGEFIVLAAGDDVSLPFRVTELVEEWLRSERRNISIFSAYDEVNAKGDFVATRIDESFTEEPDLQQLLRTRMYPLVGATHGFARPVFEQFGDILTRNAYEDRVISFRAALLDGVRYVRKPLIRYRRHENALSIGRLGGDRLKYKLKELDIASSIYVNYMKDLQLLAASGSITATYNLQQTACELFLKNRRRISMLGAKSCCSRIVCALHHRTAFWTLFVDILICIAPGKYLN